MKVIAIAHQKGGVGKTTLALNLAATLKQKLRIGILDQDPQQSAASLMHFQQGLTIIPYRDLNRLKEYGSELDLLIIDTPPYLTANLPDLFKMADFVLIPTKASFLDARAITPTVEMVKTAMKAKKNLRAGIVITMAKPRDAVARDVVRLLQENDLPVLHTQVFDRVAYKRSVLQGGVESDEKATAEMNGVMSEILEIMA